MNLPARLSLVGLLLVLAGCSTVESRIQRNPVEVPYKAAFFESNRLSGWEFIQ